MEIWELIEKLQAIAKDRPTLKCKVESQGIMRNIVDVKAEWLVAGGAQIQTVVIKWT